MHPKTMDRTEFDECGVCGGGGILREIAIAGNQPDAIVFVEEVVWTITTTTAFVTTLRFTVGMSCVELQFNCNAGRWDVCFSM